MIWGAIEIGAWIATILALLSAPDGAVRGFPAVALALGMFVPAMVLSAEALSR